MSYHSVVVGKALPSRCEGGEAQVSESIAPRDGRTIVVVNDRMQTAYRYRLSAPMGRGFDPAFKPELTPRDMLELGVFCGKYMTDCREEFPASWFKRARLASSGRDCSLNYFGVDASQPLSEWRRKGWIHPDDPRGWFQWYCRYHMGRRLPDEDRRQIRRWHAFRRHAATATAWRLRTSSPGTRRGNRSCICRRTRRDAASRPGSGPGGIRGRNSLRPARPARSDSPAACGH